jgi:hypothetical protein
LEYINFRKRQGVDKGFDPRRGWIHLYKKGVVKILIAKAESGKKRPLNTRPHKKGVYYFIS